MMRRPAAWYLFWGSVGTLAYAYAGFPLLTALRARLSPKPVSAAPITPSVSVIIVAHNEAAVITKKIDNALALDYPAERLEIIVASDGSDDGTAELAASHPSPLVRALALPRGGKNRTLNAAVAAASGEVLLFTDADSMLAPDALRLLVAPLADPEVGGVAGDYRYAGESSDGQGERTYWDLDRLLKRWQSASGSVTSATGQIYVIRRSLFEPVPLGVTDDFYTSLRVPLAGKRLLFEPRAAAYGPVAANAGAEFQRKVRVMTRGLTGVWLSRRGLNPLTYGFYAVQLLSHKVVRRLMVLPLIGLLLSAPLLWRRGWLYRLAALAQIGLHGAALLGYLLRNTRAGRLKPLSLPLFFDLVNIAALMAAANVARGKRYDLWLTQRAGEADRGEVRQEPGSTARHERAA
jgi:glycosyltransferase involved in cell wall biosynthesis